MSCSYVSRVAKLNYLIPTAFIYLIYYPDNVVLVYHIFCFLLAPHGAVQIFPFLLLNVLKEKKNTRIKYNFFLQFCLVSIAAFFLFFF